MFNIAVTSKKKKKKKNAAGNVLEGEKTGMRQEIEGERICGIFQGCFNLLSFCWEELRAGLRIDRNFGFYV